jgi:hypothetical protein
MSSPESPDSGLRSDDMMNDDLGPPGPCSKTSFPVKAALERNGGAGSIRGCGHQVEVQSHLFGYH